MSNSKYEHIWKLLNKYQFKFVLQQFDSNYHCSICKNIMKNACHNICCCKYCYECITKYLDDKEKYCPNYLEDCKCQMINLKNHIQIDHITNKKISQLKVKCPENSCQFTDELVNIENHISNHNYLKIESNSLIDNSHLINRKMDNISNTNLLMEFFLYLKTELQLLNDDNKNKENKILQMENKTQQLDDLNDNLNEEIEKLRQILNQYDCVNSNRIVQFENTKNQIEDIDSNLKRIERNTINEIKIMENQNKEMKKEIDEILKRTGKKLGGVLEVSFVDDYDLPEGGVANNVEAKKRELLNKEMDLLFNNGNVLFQWKIKRFSKKLQQAKDCNTDRLESLMMYSSSNGYQLRLVAYPNGFGDGRNKHLSVGFQILKGEYDASLCWPMNVKVIVSLLSNNSSTTFASAIFHYATHKDKNRFKRPNSDFNAAIMKPKFIKLNELLNNENLYNDDSIILVMTIG